MIRDYTPEDFEAIKRIHEKNRLDFSFPNLNSPLFVFNKVFVDDSNVVRASHALLLVAESNLWLDKSDWTDPEGKWLTIKTLDKEACDSARKFGLDGVQCFLPPTYEKFGRRISDKTDGLGFVTDRPGWLGFSKRLQSSTGDK